MKSGFITQIVLIIATLAAIYFMKEKLSKAPNDISQKLTQEFTVYPKSQTWNIDNSRELCIFYFNQCKSVPSKILFRSQDEWTDIYTYYRDNLTENGWKTESIIVTSTPTSIIFKSENYDNMGSCQIIIKEEKEDWLGLLEKRRDHLYSIYATCFPNYLTLSFATTGKWSDTTIWGTSKLTFLKCLEVKI